MIAPLAPISGRSSVPSENFVPRYKENDGNAAFLTTDCPDFTDDCGGGRVGCLNQMRAVRPPLQKKLRRFTAFA